MGHSFSQLSEYAQQAAARDDLDGLVSRERLDRLSLTLAAAKVIALFVELAETMDAIKRLEQDMRSTVEPLSNVRLQYALQHLLELMKSELDKRKVLAINSTKSEYYLDDIHGVKPPGKYNNALVEKPKPQNLFSERATKAFPSAYMDIVEAGRCLA